MKTFPHLLPVPVAKALLPAISADVTRRNLSKLHAEYSDGRWTLVATDGHVLTRIEWEPECEPLEGHLDLAEYEDGTSLSIGLQTLKTYVQSKGHSPLTLSEEGEWAFPDWRQVMVDARRQGEDGISAVGLGVKVLDQMVRSVKGLGITGKRRNAAIRFSTGRDSLAPQRVDLECAERVDLGDLGGRLISFAMILMPMRMDDDSTRFPPRPAPALDTEEDAA